jgi:hypothetical protein
MLFTHFQPFSAGSTGSTGSMNYAPASAGHETFLKFVKNDQKWPKLDKKDLFWAVFCNLDPKNPQSHPKVTPKSPPVFVQWAKTELLRHVRAFFT